MKHRLFDFYASKTWAILPEALQEMYDIYRAAIERKALDVDFDPQAVAAKLGRPLDNTRTVTTRDGVAVLPVSGPIFRYANLFTEISGATSIEVLAADFRAALDDPAVKAIVLEVNSPGGEVDGTSEFAQHIFEARNQKPVVSYVSHLGASAGYWIPSASGEIVVADTASLGSIGVVGGLRLSKDKNYVEFVSSQSPNKRPNPETESGRAQIQQHIDDLAQVFIDSVAQYRGMSPEDVVRNGGMGGLKVGQKAVDAGLADRVGTLEDLIAELSNPETRSAFAEKINKRKMVSIRDVEANESHDADSQTLGASKMADELKDKSAVVDDKDKTASAQPPKPDTDKSAAATAAASEVEQLKADKAKAEAEAKANATELAAANQARVDLEKRMAAMEKKDRDTRFGIIAKDWSGDRTFHLDMLEHLATSEKDGEQSPRFKAYVMQQTAVAEQLRQSGLFKEIGSNGHAVSDSPQEQAQAEARALMGKDSNLTFAEAMKQVYAASPHLYEGYRSETSVRV